MALILHWRGQPKSNTLRKGRISVIEYFETFAQALEAVGLSEQDAHADSGLSE